ncbi:hypothetical protein Agub_g15744, partial [Astrephomene gubernaculifera]
MRKAALQLYVGALLVTFQTLLGAAASTIALGDKCIIQDDCPAGKFCAQPPLSHLLPGCCESCWRCCLFPEVYGTAACSSRCSCGQAAACYDDAECGEAEFCGVLSSRLELPICRSCAQCRSDAQATSVTPSDGRSSSSAGRRAGGGSSSNGGNGGCAAACPSGALDANAVAAGVQRHYLYAAFAIAEDEGAAGGMAVRRDGVVTVTLDALRLWLNHSGVAPTLFPAFLQGLPVLRPAGAAADPRVTLAAFATRLAALSPPLDPMCPRPFLSTDGQEASSSSGSDGTSFQISSVSLPDYGASYEYEASSAMPATGTAAAAAGAGVWEGMPPPDSEGFDSVSTVVTASSANGTVRVVLPGCPCAASPAATEFRCPVGHRCSRAAWRSLPGDVLTLGTAALMRARCVDCGPGSVCPEGSYVEEEEDPRVIAGLDCPAGQFCPRPAQQKECPAGFFCPHRAVQPTTCDFTVAFSSKQQASPSSSASSSLTSAQQQEMLRRLRDEGQPLRGNYCPPGSDSPSTRCSPGHYCPNTSLQLPCPQRHYCRAESIAPTPCPPLTLCPATATDAPAVWPAATAVIGGVLAAAVAVAALLTWLDNVW